MLFEAVRKRPNLITAMGTAQGKKAADRIEGFRETTNQGVQGTEDMCALIGIVNLSAKADHAGLT